MQTWNHRVIKRTEDGKDYYGIHEVHYDEVGKPVACTENAVSVDYCEDLESILWTLNRMREAVALPVLKYEDF